MHDWHTFFKNKRITIMGLGLLGRGVGDAKFLAEMDAELVVTDLKTEEELKDSLEQLKGFPNITYRLGGHDLADFRDRDFILKAAGVPLDSPYIEEARKHGIPIKMSASWFTELAGNIPTVGVTGTRGKSTVTHMLDVILKEAGKHVLLGGNVRGVSTLALLPEVTSDSVALMELDSWQLQGFGDAQISPDIAVFTTFYDDHLNYYRGDRDAYLEDKAQIFLHQTSRDVLVVSSQVAPILEEKYRGRIPGQLAVADSEDFPPEWHLTIPGEHNRLNAVCAIAAARALGIEYGNIRKGVEQFTGVPGRLELVREIDGIKFYNDTTATAPEATRAALRALDPDGQKNIVLIMGGTDKELAMNTLLAEIPLHTKRVILLAGTGTNRILEFLPGASVFDNLEAAVTEAHQVGTAGDSILFSPAFASFGMFKNEFDRGDRFIAIVNQL